MNARVAVYSALLLGVVAGFVALRGWRPSSPSVEWSRQAVAAVQPTLYWPAPARSAVRLMLRRYGLPESWSYEGLVWRNRGPWARVVVSARPHSPLEQDVAYPLDEAQARRLRRFPHGLEIDEARGLLGARSDREWLNVLALNLADDIVKGRRTPEEASGFFLKTASQTLAGKSSPYTEGLRFKTPGRRPPAFSVRFAPGPRW
ncbi:MAG: hypothetical protein PHF00_03105 [Elusimicrobia bacterium]|nr:hypothetical protein [Elusimicrobiota bacterium]